MHRVYFIVQDLQLMYPRCLLLYSRGHYEDFVQCAEQVLFGHFRYLMIRIFVTKIFQKAHGNDKDCVWRQVSKDFRRKYIYFYFVADQHFEEPIWIVGASHFHWWNLTLEILAFIAGWSCCIGSWNTFLLCYREAITLPFLNNNNQSKCDILKVLAPIGLHTD